MQKPPSECGKVLPILQVRAPGHRTRTHRRHHDLVIKPWSISQNERGKKHDMGKKVTCRQDQHRDVHIASGLAA